jgi:excisionase family DNA binding protein
MTEVERMKTTSALTVSPQEAAARLGLGRGTVYQLLRSGQLPAIRVGRNYRVLVAGLPDLLAKLSGRSLDQALAKARRSARVRRGVSA